MRRSRRDDRGAGTVLGISLASVLLLVAVAATGVSGLLVAQRRAQSAADLGALAGAIEMVRGGASPCRAAAAVVRRNGARVLGCRADTGSVFLVVARRGLPRVAGAGPWWLAARARAGPQKVSEVGPATTR